MVYLLIGQDLPAKDSALKRLKEEYLSEGLQELNLDILYGKEISLKELQEKVMNIPAGPSIRIIVIKNAQSLKKELADFIFHWSKKEDQKIILVLDIERQGKDELSKRLSVRAKVLRFKEEITLSSFDLSRYIEKGQVTLALKALRWLLQEEGKPEMILGGLRYSLENQRLGREALRKKIGFLLNCDIEIKTGRLKPVFALEKLVINLCGLR